MSEHTEAVASEVKDALKFYEVVENYLFDPDKWDRLIKDRPQRLPRHVKEAATDIGHDMLLEAGFFYDDEVADFINSLLTMFETGFLYGAAFQAEPSNHPEPSKNQPEPTVSVPTEEFFEILRLVVEVKAQEKNQ